MTLSSKQIKLIAIWFPILFSFVYAFICYLFTILHPQDLTQALQTELKMDASQTFWVSLLILLPNLLLSLIMFIYINSVSFEGPLLLLPCFLAILFGILPVLYIYYFFYYTLELQMAVFSYGFPFAYFLGMMIGWVLGVFIAASWAKQS